MYSERLVLLWWRRRLVLGGSGVTHIKPKAPAGYRAPGPRPQIFFLSSPAGTLISGSGAVKKKEQPVDSLDSLALSLE